MKTSNELQALFSSLLTPAELAADKKMALISAAIASWRESKEMTQAEFARFMGVTQAMVSKWESGAYNFTVKTLSEVSDKLGISLDELFCGSPVMLSYSKQLAMSSRMADVTPAISVSATRPFSYSDHPSSLKLYSYANGGAA